MVIAFSAASTGTRWLGPRMSPERVRLVTVAGGNVGLGLTLAGPLADVRISSAGAQPAPGAAGAEIAAAESASSATPADTAAQVFAAMMAARAAKSRVRR